MNNVVTTANGKNLDMEALRLQNEKTVAVGNMKVNARGDEISPTTGEVTRTRNQRMSEYYRLHSTVPTKRPKTPEPEVRTPVQEAPVVETPKPTTSSSKKSAALVAPASSVTVETQTNTEE